MSRRPHNPIWIFNPSSYFSLLGHRFHSQRVLPSSNTSDSSQFHSESLFSQRDHIPTNLSRRKTFHNHQNSFSNQILKIYLFFLLFTESNRILKIVLLAASWFHWRWVIAWRNRLTDRLKNCLGTTNGSHFFQLAIEEFPVSHFVSGPFRLLCHVVYAEDELCSGYMWLDLNIDFFRK